MSIIRSAAAAMLSAAALFPVTATAEQTPAQLTYEQFEAAVPHIDLENCPDSLAQENAFCRASILHEQIHVFVFSYDGDSPMVGFATFEADGIETLLN
ncbi:hypothetical protein [Aliiroseovarius sediminis]|uniref:hypothetical protein n=1 Tax=Aliiroseovarius sediminis TaxID=2925839 RepID=UPI001F58E47C|nr:hypothetical protein [Aliiroseovarius sediminis]MCI2393502.1 hypothetical protein [Aliiroseovarius sediminis]